MNADKALGIVSAIVTVALVTTIVAHPASVALVNALGSTFVNSLRAAQGK